MLFIDSTTYPGIQEKDQDQGIRRYQDRTFRQMNTWSQRLYLKQYISEIRFEVCANRQYGKRKSNHLVEYRTACVACDMWRNINEFWLTDWLIELASSLLGHWRHFVAERNGWRHRWYHWAPAVANIATYPSRQSSSVVVPLAV